MHSVSLSGTLHLKGVTKLQLWISHQHQATCGSLIRLLPVLQQRTGLRILGPHCTIAHGQQTVSLSVSPRKAKDFREPGPAIRALITRRTFAVGHDVSYSCIVVLNFEVQDVDAEVERMIRADSGRPRRSTGPNCRSRGRCPPKRQAAGCGQICSVIRAPQSRGTCSRRRYCRFARSLAAPDRSQSGLVLIRVNLINPGCRKLLHAGCARNRGHAERRPNRLHVRLDNGIGRITTVSSSIWCPRT